MTLSTPTVLAAGRPVPPTRSRSRALLTLVGIGLLAGAGMWWAFGRTYHFAVVQPGILYRDGNPSLWRFKQSVGRANPKVVVCLVDDDEVASKEKQQFARELQYLDGRGIRALRIPIRLGGWPTTENVRDFLGMVADPTSRPVLLHCAQGVRRTGMLVAAYQMSVQGFSPNQAKGAILTFGHSDRTMNDIRTFIDNYDPRSQAVNLLPASQVKE